MSESRMYLTFLVPPDRIGRVRELDVEDDWRHFTWSDTIWIDQTYLRMRDAGHNVRLSTTLPACGLVVYHPDSCERFEHLKFGEDDVITVAVRADGGPQYGADFEIVQNRGSANGRRCFSIPHWPQPGLRPRDPHRGATVQNVGYKGDLLNLHPAFRADRWETALEENSMRWLPAAQGFPDGSDTPLSVEWNDYSKVDVVLGVRPDLDSRYPKKPASKLINAWHAGVPALLGPEVAFRELRRSELDYIEIQSPEDALAAIRRLRADPDLYRQMVENGKQRAKKFSVATITSRWVELLFDTIPRRAAGLGPRVVKRLPGPVRYRLRKFKNMSWGERFSRMITVPSAVRSGATK